MGRKLILDIETEELLKKLEETPVEPEDEDYFESDDPTLLFIRKYNIRPGENRFPTSILHRLFKLTFPDSLNQFHFTLAIAKYLPYEQTNNGKYIFLIDTNVMSINKEIQRLTAKKDLRIFKSPKFMQHFEDFIKEMDIKPGKNWTCINDLYDLWKKFRKEVKKSTTLISRKQLQLLLDRTFKHKKLNNLEYYLTNIPRKENEKETK